RRSPSLSVTLTPHKLSLPLSQSVLSLSHSHAHDASALSPSQHTSSLRSSFPLSHSHAPHVALCHNIYGGRTLLMC
ncbi:hypothetical protein D0Y65_030550, partial [Glycine soja]